MKLDLRDLLSLHPTPWTHYSEPGIGGIAHLLDATGKVVGMVGPSGLLPGGQDALAAIVVSLVNASEEAAT